MPIPSLPLPVQTLVAIPPAKKITYNLSALIILILDGIYCDQTLAVPQPRDNTLKHMVHDIHRRVIFYGKQECFIQACVKNLKLEARGVITISSRTGER